MKRAEILDTAKGYVTRDRAATHGRAEDQFATIGQLWGALLGVPVTPAKVALMMAGLKLVRAWGNPAHEDNFIDLAGYAACGGEIATGGTLPREGLPFEVVKAERDAAREAALTEMARLGQEFDAPPQPIGEPHSAMTASGYAGVATRDATAWAAQISGGEE